MIKTTSLIPVLALLLFAVQAQDANIAADPNRMKARIDALGEFGKNPQGGVSRIAYSDADIAGRRYITSLIREALSLIHI